MKSAASSSKSFDEFAYQDSPLNVKSKKGDKKKIILLSDDEEEEAEHVVTRNSGGNPATGKKPKSLLIQKALESSDNEWISARSPVRMTSLEKNVNIQHALVERKKQSFTTSSATAYRIPKRSPSEDVIGGNPSKRVAVEESQGSEKDVIPSSSSGRVNLEKVFSKPNAVPASILNKALDAEYDPLQKARKTISEETNQVREERLQQRALQQEQEVNKSDIRTESTKSTTGKKNRILLSDDDDDEEIVMVSSTTATATAPSQSRSATNSVVNLADEDDNEEFPVKKFTTTSVKSSSAHQRNNGKKKNNRVFASSDEEDEGATGAQDAMVMLDDEEEEEEVVKQPKYEKKSKESNNSRKSKKVVEVQEESDEEDAKMKGITINDDDDEDGWDQEKSKQELDEYYAYLQSYCAALQDTLQTSLLKYAVRSGQTAQMTGEGPDGDCINLLDIDMSSFGEASSSSSSKQKEGKLISAEEINTFCDAKLVLKSYQLVGVNWLKLLYEHEVNGILADDMGLGKTVQTIAFLAWLSTLPAVMVSSSSSSRKKKVPHLIIVPASTLANWSAEFSKFAPALNVFTYHGTQAERQDARMIIKERLSDNTLDVILTTYTLFERESNKQDRGFFFSLSFHYLVVDEGHCLKNSTSARYKTLSNLKTMRRLLLSGTPVQNNVQELLSLLSFAMPHLFRLDDCFALLQSMGWHTNKADESAASKKRKNGLVIALKKMLRPFVLRRVKNDVLSQLGVKLTYAERLSPTTYQQQLYDQLLLQYSQSHPESTSANTNGKLTKNAAKEDAKRKKGEDEVIDLSETPARSDSSSKAMSTRGGSGKSTKITDWIPTAKAASSEAIDLLDDDDEAVTAFPLVSTSSVNGIGEENTDPLTHHTLSEAKHLFTSLRKVANHPLLLRVHYQDSNLIDKIASIAYAEGYFGMQCNLQRVKEEIMNNFNDLDCHQLCMYYEHQLGQYGLSQDTLFASPKMRWLQDTLPKLQVSFATGHSNSYVIYDIFCNCNLGRRTSHVDFFAMDKTVGFVGNFATRSSSYALSSTRWVYTNQGKTNLD
jgi:SNF2 family DNA or RNA helicase